MWGVGDWIKSNPSGGVRKAANAKASAFRFSPDALAKDEVFRPLRAPETAGDRACFKVGIVAVSIQGFGGFKMIIKKKAAPKINLRKKERRKPGDQRFPGRLVDKRPGPPRKGDRRGKDRRKPVAGK